MIEIRTLELCFSSALETDSDTPVEKSPDDGSMGSEESQQHDVRCPQSWSVCLHSFCDLSSVSPVVFLYLLKECYFTGTCKATAKFRALQHQVYQTLHNDPQPGPATFVAQCLYVLPLLGEHCEGFSHLVTSALYRRLKTGTTPSDSLEAKQLAARLFLCSIEGDSIHQERILVKMVQLFDVRLINIEKAMCDMGFQSKDASNMAKQIVEQYIFGLMDSQSYMTIVGLLEQFSIHHSGQSFLFKMIEKREFKAAEKWATFMGRPMLCMLIQEYIKKNKFKFAFEIVRKNNLQEEFPDIYNKYKTSSLKKLAEKGCWDVAEARTRDDGDLIEYLVYLAMEAGYTEKVDELCNRYSLDDFVKAKEPEASAFSTRYLQLNELVLEDIVWVDELNGLEIAANHIEESKIVGLDCEWKPNYVKGSKPNKVSIIQIASERIVYIFDLIKLVKTVPHIIDDCLARILHSPHILKLGYNFQCDLQQLAHSYGELECFKRYEMLLDIQSLFKDPRGGLSGLAEKILGAGLNKTRRNSDWEQRPLSQNQLEYAALDAAVLIHIFMKVGEHGVSDGCDKIEWKSRIVSLQEKAVKK